TTLLLSCTDLCNRNAPATAKRSHHPSNRISVIPPPPGPEGSAGAGPAREASPTSTLDTWAARCGAVVCWKQGQCQRRALRGITTHMRGGVNERGPCRSPGCVE